MIYNKINWIILLIPLVLFSDDYTFNASEFEKKPFEFSGTIEFRPSLTIPQNQSTAWKLKNHENNNPPQLLDNYLLIATPSAKFEKKKILFYSSADLRVEYNNPESRWNFRGSLLEGYGKYAFSSNWNFLAGKKLYKWGNGYIYNPVSYAGRTKDVNDIDASLEGYYSTAMQYNKSFSSPILSNFSHETVLLPVYGEINNNYTGGDKLWLLNHSYVLFLNTDVHIFINVAQEFDFSVGFSAAYNILTNWEIHGELSYLPQVNSTIIGSNTMLSVTEKKDIIQSVIGTRYLTTFDATFYLEYLFNGNGYNQNEMNLWYSSAKNALASENLQHINSVRKYWFENLSRQFLMNHYIFFKVQYPEPFNFLYFTPSLYILFNIEDNSFMAGFDMIYKRFENISFNLKLVGLSGDDMSEFGSKISKVKTELNVESYF
ncbi:MAG: hypothetical protein JW913_16625 [Chitinispirillaceae bacterium]|nr:hypothetical protein [Chitinispirillaceae bacterium]